MNNIQKAGKYFMYLFYTLITQTILAVIFLLTIQESNSSDFNTLVTIFGLIGASCTLLIFIFLYKAAYNLMQNENDYWNLRQKDDEILTTGEIMKRMRMDTESNQD